MKRRQRYALSTIAFSVALTSTLNPCSARTFDVRCQSPGQGHSLARALAMAGPGDVIELHGVCTQRVSITKDHVTLDGLGSAVIQGTGLAFRVIDPLVSVDGAQGVVIRGLRVENAPAEGIGVQNAASLSLENVTLRASTIGLAVSASSTARLADVNVESNFIGIDVFTGSSLVLEKRVTASNNQRNGFDVTGNSTIEVRGAQVEANSNGGHGITLDQSQLLVLGFPPSQGSSITTNGNQGNGILVSQSSLTVFGDPGANRVTTTNNAGNGILVVLGGRLLNPQSSALFTVGSNATGIRFETNSSASIAGGLQVHSNGTGVIADGAGVLAVGSTAQAPSAITGNTVRDFDARFGSRIRVSGAQIGTVACEATVLSQGLCP